MGFLETIAKAKEFLREHGRVSLRALQREFGLDDEALDELIEELVEIQQIAVRDGKALAWAGLTTTETAPLGRAAARERDPRDYTPKHLADKILRSKSALEGERKQVTVLFTDVKGSMELAEQLDPETWHQILDRFFQILTDGVHRFEGTVNQYTGDGIMALFGAPIAHEDHAQRACYAALQLRDEIARYATEVKREHGLGFSTRMGIHSGEVVVGKIGDDLRMDYTAQGHTVGLAQRVEALAAPNAVYLSAETSSLVSGYFELEDLGPFRVKGASDPVRVSELRGVGSHHTRFDVSRARGLTRFVGRQREIRALGDALEKAAEGHAQAVGLVADAGTGKSRLAFEFCEVSRGRGARVTAGHGVPHGGAIPLLPILEQQREGLGITDQDDAHRIRQKIAGAMVLSQQELGEVLPIVYELFGVPDPDLPVPDLEPEARQRQVFDILRRALIARSKRSLAVILLEDLHWFDPESMGFLSTLMEAIQGTRTLLLFTFRPEFSAEWMGRSYYQQISLQELGSDALDELLGDLLGRGPSLDGLGERIVARTGGNPFFVEEIVQDLAESGALQGTKGAYRLARSVEKIAIPQSVQALLAARIDRLPEREKRVLQTAAVIGTQFPEELLEKVAELPARDLRDALQKLAAGEFVYEAELFPRAAFAFKHPLTRDVAYRSLLTDRRRLVHEAVARALEAADPESSEQNGALLAHHWEEAGRHAEAARAHLQAADQALASDPDASIDRWRRVCALLEQAEETPESIGMQIRARRRILGLGWGSGLSPEEAEEVFVRGCALARRAEDDRSRVLMQRHFAITLHLAGRDERSLELLAEAQALSERLEDPRLRGEVIAARALVQSQLGLHRAPLDEISRALEDLGGGSGRLSAVEAYLLVGKVAALIAIGQPREALAVSEAVLPRMRESGYPAYLSQLTGFLSGIAEMTGEWEGVAARTREVAALAERTTGTVPRAVIHAALGRTCTHLGALDEARAALTHALHLSEAWRWNHQTEIGVGVSFSAYHLAAGDPAEAERCAARAVERARAFGKLRHEAWAEIHLARALLATNDPERHPEVEAALGRVGELMQGRDLDWLAPPYQLLRGELAKRTGDAEEHEGALREALRIYQDWGNRAEAERIARELES